MKTNRTATQRPNDEAAPALTGGDLLHLDGQTFTGPRGVLAVALKPATLEHVRREARATHWVVPLDHPALVRAAVDLPGEIIWVSSTPPAAALGLLAEGYRGAWFEHGHVLVNLDGLTHRWHMHQPPPASFAAHYLARMVATLWTESAPPVPELTTQPTITVVTA